MIIDMGPLLRGETKCISIDYALAPITLDGVRFTSDARIAGALTDSAGYMKLTLTATLPYIAECARCLCEIDGIFTADFIRTVATPKMLTEQQIADNIDEYVLIRDGILDIDEELSESLVLEFPTKLLCSVDCEGLCAVCGKPKREGCGCVEKHIDPRLEVLARLLEKDDN